LQSEPTALAADHQKPEDPGWSIAWKATLGSRLFVWLVVVVVLSCVSLNQANVLSLDPHLFTAPFASAEINKLFAPAGRWDSVWYMQVAVHGYTPSLASENFFPLYPLLVHVVGWVVRVPLVAGLFVSLLAMLASLWLLYALARLDVGEAGARTAVVLMALYPMSLFMSAVYTESLFLAVTIGSLYAARRERWFVAGLCAALASATRSNGVLLLVPLAVLYLYGPRGIPAERTGVRWFVPRYRIRPSLAWLLLVPVGLLAYMLYLQLLNGTPLEPFRAQQQFWGHHFAGPFGAIVDAIKALPHDIHAVWTHTGQHQVDSSDPISWNAHALIDFAFLPPTIWALIIGLRRVPLAYTLYSLLSLCFITSVPTVFEALQSLDRYTLSIFPLFIAAGGYFAERRRARAAVYVLFTALLGVFCGLWAIWAWVA
jgi:hypothetical protein